MSSLQTIKNMIKYMDHDNKSLMTKSCIQDIKL